MKTIITLAVLGLMQWISTPVSAQDAVTDATQVAPGAASFQNEFDVAKLISTAATAYTDKDYDLMAQALERAVLLRPHLAHLRFNLAKAYALQDDKTSAYNALLILQKQGLSFNMDGDPDFENIRNYQVYDYLQQNFSRQGEPYGNAENAFSLTGTGQFLESIEFDPKSGRFFMGSITEGQIYQRTENGDVSVFAAGSVEKPLFSIFDLAVDSDRGVLWALTGYSPYEVDGDPRLAGRTFLVRLDLETGEETGRYASTTGSFLLDLAVNPTDGSVYAADSSQPVLWTLPAASLAAPAGPLVLYFELTAFTSIRAIAIDDAGQRLYFSDYELGLFGVDMEKQEPFEVHMGDQLNTAGIDGLHWFEDSLVLLQNGYQPHRVLRIRLDDTRRGARHAQAMLSNLPEFRSPVAAAVKGDELYVIANSHRSGYDPRSGKVLPEAALEPHQILKTSLNEGWMPLR